VHVKDAKSPKKAWDILVKMYNINTQTFKMQFKQKLHNFYKKKMNINDCSTNVKNLVDVLGFIRTFVNDEDPMAMTLNGFGKKL
jgi:hypothetical protein